MTKLRAHEGFTIIELLIATTVFSLFLLLLSAVTLRIGRLYSKGVISTKTQEAARSITNDIAKSIQFSGSDVKSGPNYICAGAKRFMFKSGLQLIDNGVLTADQTSHVLISDTPALCPGTISSFGALSAGQRELMPSRMRLANLTISPATGSSGLFTINIRVVYGDFDLLSNPNAPNASCKPNIGTEFCSVSDLTTTVQKRL